MHIRISKVGAQRLCNSAAECEFLSSAFPATLSLLSLSSWCQDATLILGSCARIKWKRGGGETLGFFLAVRKALKQISPPSLLVRIVPHPVSKPVTSKGNGFALIGLPKHVVLLGRVSREQNQASASKGDKGPIMLRQLSMSAVLLKIFEEESIRIRTSLFVSLGKWNVNLLWLEKHNVRFHRNGLFFAFLFFFPSSSSFFPFLCSLSFQSVKLLNIYICYQSLLFSSKYLFPPASI